MKYLLYFVALVFLFSGFLSIRAEVRLENENYLDKPGSPVDKPGSPIGKPGNPIGRPGNPIGRWLSVWNCPYGQPIC